ncbi:MAG: type II toxin-antitoxin system RelE/ParE family toxin [Burkholderiales bacterium]
MITSFHHKGLGRFFTKGDYRGIAAAFATRIERILDRLDAAVKPDDMDLPGYKFHQLTGDRKGTYSVTVTGNWRITFKFDGENAVDVDYEDYH